MNIFGFELIKLSLFTKGLLFAVLLMVAIHYGVILAVKNFSRMKERDLRFLFLTLIYIFAVSFVFFLFIRESFFYRIISYIILSLYLLILLSRGFVNWYTRTEEISKKLDKIIELLQKSIK